MTESVQKHRKAPSAWQDPNSIYWLEIRQARRNYILYEMIVFGILAGVYLITLFAMGDADTIWNEPPLLLLPIMIYAIGPLQIPLYCGTKLVTQLRRGDLVMETPFPPTTIFWGKLQVVFTLAICLYAPSIPGVIALCFLEKTYFLLFVLFLPIATVFIAMMLLGFMAGARTTPLAIAMIALFFLFFSINLGLTCGMVSLHFNPFFFLSPGFYTLLYIDAEDFFRALFGFSAAVAFNLVPCFLIFIMGILMLGRNRNLMFAMKLPLLLLFLFSPMLLLIGFMTEIGWAAQTAALLLTLVYFGSPALALYLVHRYNLSQRNVVTNTEVGRIHGFFKRIFRHKTNKPKRAEPPHE